MKNPENVKRQFYQNVIKVHYELCYEPPICPRLHKNWNGTTTSKVLNLSDHA